MQKNTNETPQMALRGGELSSESETERGSNTPSGSMLTNPIVSAVTNEIHPPASVGYAVPGVPKNASTSPTPRRESVEQGLTPSASSPIVSVVKNEIHPHTSVGQGGRATMKSTKADEIRQERMKSLRDEILPTARISSVEDVLAPSASHKSNTAGKGRAHPTSSQTNTIITDPNGSYTGTPLNPTETPVQDVDDL